VNYETVWLENWMEFGEQFRDARNKTDKYKQ
jgi:hypothetical protein